MRRGFTIFGLAVLLIARDAAAQFIYPDDNACTTPKRTRGSCINIKSCPEMLNLLLQKPLTAQAREYLRQSQCGFDGNDPIVCCESSGSSSLPTQTPEPLPPKQQTTDSVPDVTNHPNLRLLDHTNCGPINADKIIGGSVAKIKEFPWMALLAYNDGRRDPVFRCGGSVINNRYILTAAHCVTSLPSNLRLIGVRVGEHNLQTERDCEMNETFEQECADKYQDFGIDQVIYHPQYSSVKLQNDVALIRVNRNIDFRANNAKPICLPIGLSSVIKSKKLVVTGWGVTEAGISSQVMLKVLLPLFPMDECANVYKKQTEIWHKQICMGGEQGKDSCSGDSGGPLQGPTVYNGNSHYVQYGIVSFGVRNCGTQNFPGVYTRVDHYLDWILDNLSN